MGNCNCSCTRDEEREVNLEIHNIVKDPNIINNEKSKLITA